MRITAIVAGNNIFGILVSLGILLILRHDLHDEAKCSLFSYAKEIEPTKEWQLLGENDTIPAGLHVRMDMTTGEKWAKIMDEDDGEVGDEDKKQFKDVHINAGRNSKSSVSLAIVKTDGDVEIEQNDNDGAKTSRNSTNYDFDMMFRTLSKLPQEEIEAMGGLPELPNSKKGPARIAFEEGMLNIWKKRQAELLDLEMNFPEILKARIAGIKEYLENPEERLENLDLDADMDNNVVTDIVSLLKDLEFQISDLDMARDFHTMDGWPLLVKLLLKDSHLPDNKTIHDLSRSTKTKIRTIQSYAAWAIGTAVKNHEEFFPYGVESVVLEDMKTSTAIDLLIDIFCDQYDDSSSWEIRTLLTKGIYAIGAILRNNELAQTHIVKTDGFDRLGQKYRELSKQGFNSANTKLIQRMAGLSTDIVEELSLHIQLSETRTDTKIIHSISSAFCYAVCELFSSETFVPVKVQETLVKAIAVMGPHCQESTCAASTVRSVVETIQSDWFSNKNSFDADHFQELLDLAREAFESLGSQMDKDEL
jgi:nucleotide exchange factor SIL1